MSEDPWGCHDHGDAHLFCEALSGYGCDHLNCTQMYPEISGLPPGPVVHLPMLDQQSREHRELQRGDRGDRGDRGPRQPGTRGTRGTWTSGTSKTRGAEEVWNMFDNMTMLPVSIIADRNNTRSIGRLFPVCSKHINA